MTAPRRPPRRRRHPSAGRWLALVLFGAALFAAGLYLGRTGGPTEPEPAGGAPASRPAPTSPEPRRTTAEPSPPPVPSEPEHPEPVAGAEPPAVPLPVEGPPPPGEGAAVALVIDDLGRSVADLDRIEALGVPITYAVLPFESHTAEVVGALSSRGAEVILHLPMEPANGADPGPGALTRTMGRAELSRATREALGAVPGAVGVNNHMGSSLSAHRPSMEAILRVIGERGLYFLDSRTSAESVAFTAARELDVAAAERQVFLDPDPRPEAVRYQFRRLLDAARERGAAVAIGHPHPHTLAVLEEEVPLAVERGYRFVPVSYLVERSSVAAR